MKIVVCVKQVPDTKAGVKFKPDGTLDRNAMASIMNPDDKAGLEAALRIKDDMGADNVEITVVTMGRQAIDGDTAQVGPQISEHLDLPLISYAEELKIEGDSVVVKRQYDDRHHILKAKMPCLITALSELNEPRYMTPGGIFDAFEEEITVFDRDALDTLEDCNMGLKGSPTQIAKASDKVAKGAGEKVAPETASEAADYILAKLAEKFVI